MWISRRLIREVVVDIQLGVVVKLEESAETDNYNRNVPAHCEGSGRICSFVVVDL